MKIYKLIEYIYIYFLRINTCIIRYVLHAPIQCQVLLWLDSKTVAPRQPIAVDFETPQYKRYEVNLGLPEMPQLIVRTEKRGDAMVIEVREKPGTGPAKPLEAAEKLKTQRVEPDTVRHPNRASCVKLAHLYTHIYIYI